MKILLVRTGGLGDSILTLPVASCLKKIAAGGELHVLGNETMLDVARLSGLFDGFRSVDESGFSSLYYPSKPSDFLQAYFSYFDEVYFFTAGNSDTLARKVIESGAGKCSVLDPRPSDNLRTHISEHLLLILHDTYCKPDRYGITLHTLSRTGRDGCIIHPGSGSILKNWPIDRYLLVAQKVNMKVTFILGPAERERGIGSGIPEDSFNVVCTDSLSELYRVICGASVYCGNDSGVSHLAALCETPAVILFGPTDPVVWRPLGRDVAVISSYDASMNGISVDEVIMKIEKAVTL